MANIIISFENDPPVPPAGTLVIWAKSPGEVWVKDSSGRTKQLDIEINDLGTDTREVWSARKTSTEINAVSDRLVNHENSSTAHPASNITYDNSESGLLSNEVQGAIDEVLLSTKARYKSGVIPEGAQDGVNNVFYIPDNESYVLDTLAVF